MTIEAFDPDQYLDATQSAVPATDFTPVPATDYPAHVKPSSVKVNLVPFREDAKTGVHLVKADGSTIFGGKELELYWVIDDPAVAESLGLQEAVVRQRFLLDLTASGDIASGVNKNVRLGKLQELAGIDPSKGWSFRQLEVAVGTIRVGHRPDKRDPEKVYAEVVAVARA